MVHCTVVYIHVCAVVLCFVLEQNNYTINLGKNLLYMTVIQNNDTSCISYIQNYSIIV